MGTQIGGGGGGGGTTEVEDHAVAQGRLTL